MLRSLNNEPFAMEPNALEAFLAKMERIENGTAVKLEDRALSDQGPYALTDATAVIPVSGILLKSDSDAQMLRAYGENATGYGELVAAIDAAEADPSVARILLAVDSPGGQVSGIHAVADRLDAVRKPMHAHIDSLGASAAYWIASQADGISASRGAMIGSIGAYVPVLDLSKMAERVGIKVHVVSSGPYKGAGVPGAEIKPEHLADIQARINQIRDEFVADIARGRGMDATAINESADGRVYNVSESLQRGLIDRKCADPEKERKMAEANDRKQYAALIKEFPNHAALVAEAMESGADVAAIRSSIAKAEADKVAAAREAELAAVKAELEASKKDSAEKAAALAKLQTEHDALKALADGAKAGNAVKPDPAPVKKLSVTKAAFAEMSPSQKAAHLQAGGEIAAE